MTKDMGSATDCVHNTSTLPNSETGVNVNIDFRANGKKLAASHAEVIEPKASLTRRMIMNVAIATPLFGKAFSSGFLSPASAKHSSDDVLASLLVELKDVQQKLRAADDECERCQIIYNELKPERPHSLLWSAGDPVSHSGEKYNINGKWFLWCDFRSIDRLEISGCEDWIFVGTAEEAAALCIPNGPHGKTIPVVGKEHLFKRWTNKRSELRAAQLIAALKAYRDQDSEAESRSGIDAACEACDELYERKWEILARMKDITPTTLAGLKALAEAIKTGPWNGQLGDGDAIPDQMIAKLVNGLLHSREAAA